MTKTWTNTAVLACSLALVACERSNDAPPSAAKTSAEEAPTQPGASARQDAPPAARSAPPQTVRARGDEPAAATLATGEEVDILDPAMDPSSPRLYRWEVEGQRIDLRVAWDGDPASGKGQLVAVVGPRVIPVVPFEVDPAHSYWGTLSLRDDRRVVFRFGETDASGDGTVTHVLLAWNDTRDAVEKAEEWNGSPLDAPPTW